MFWYKARTCFQRWSQHHPSYWLVVFIKHGKPIVWGCQRYPNFGMPWCTDIQMIGKKPDIICDILKTSKRRPLLTCPWTVLLSTGCGANCETLAEALFFAPGAVLFSDAASYEVLLVVWFRCFSIKRFPRRGYQGPANPACIDFPSIETQSRSYIFSRWCPAFVLFWPASLAAESRVNHWPVGMGFGHQGTKNAFDHEME